MSPRPHPGEGSLLPDAWRSQGHPAPLPLALALDAAFGEPPARLHPVVWIGSVVSALERRAPAGATARLLYGAGCTGLVVGGAAALGGAISRLASRLPFPLGLLLEGWLLKTMLSARALIEAGRLVEARLKCDDLEGAREAARALVSRDVRVLDCHLLTSAAIESLAENTSDSIVAPLFYYALGGLPAALAYRAANTLDAMVGYRGEYEHLGKVAARLDDLLNLVPARLTSALLLAGGAIAGGDLRNGLALTLRDRGRTASPNAGWPMSTIAGLLGTRLEKPGHYVLGGELPPPDLPAIDHAAELVRAATLVTLPLVLGVRWLARRRRPHPAPLTPSPSLSGSPLTPTPLPHGGAGVPARGRGTTGFPRWGERRSPARNPA